MHRECHVTSAELIWDLRLFIVEPEIICGDTFEKIGPTLQPKTVGPILKNGRPDFKKG